MNDKPLGDLQDVYMPDPGLVEGPVQCGVCGTEMSVERNVNGPTGYVMAISGSKRLHDFFWCPRREEPWHKKVMALRRLKSDTPSVFIATILQAEIEMVLAYGRGDIANS